MHYVYDMVLRGGLSGNEGSGPSDMALLYSKQEAIYLNNTFHIGVMSCLSNGRNQEQKVHHLAKKFGINRIHESGKLGYHLPTRASHTIYRLKLCR